MDKLECYGTWIVFWVDRIDLSPMKLRPLVGLKDAWYMFTKSYSLSPSWFSRN